MSLDGLTLHPVIRVFGFLIVGSALALGGLPELLFTGPLLGCLYLLARYTGQRGYPSQGLWPMVRRMRWLFLSLLVIYFWFTPGQPLLPVQGMPTWEGVTTGVLRIASLIMLVVAVHVLLTTTPRTQLVTALHWLMRPLDYIGVSAERFALRTALTLDAVVTVQGLLSQQKMAGSTVGNPITRIGVMGASWLQHIIERAESAPLQRMDLPDGGHPPWPQWAYPLLLGATFWLLR